MNMLQEMNYNIHKREHMKNLYEIEEIIHQYWENINLYETLRKKVNKIGKAKRLFIGPLGPATKNSKPSLHHVYMKTIRDAIVRYNFLKGYYIESNVYWEAHGSTVEKQALKELGLFDRKSVEKYGTDKFCNYCRKSIFSKYDEFKNFSHKIGEISVLNSKRSTDDMHYVETVWWLLKKMYHDNLVQKGEELVNYCVNCGNIVDNFEATKASENKQITEAYVLLPVNSESEVCYIVVECKDIEILPHVAGVHFNYQVPCVEYRQDEKRWILPETIAKKSKTKCSYVGHEELKQLFSKTLKFVDKELPFVENERLHFSFFVPSFDEIDYEYAKKNGIEIEKYLDARDGMFYENMKTVARVKEKLNFILNYLRKNEEIVFERKTLKKTFKCPFCGYSLQKATNENLVLKTTELKTLLIHNANKIKFVPSELGKKRMMEWLENVRDWNISRNRIFGTPIPLYECECGHSMMLGSFAELERYSADSCKSTIDNISSSNLDARSIKCPNCNKIMERVPFTLDCWFDSGAFPIAQYHYPFENVKLDSESFVADIIIEGLDQTRGWFYSMLVVSAYLFDLPPSKEILTVNMLLNENGKKMSKVRNTVVSPYEILEKTGVDTLRWSLLKHSPVWNNINFRDSDVINVYHHFIPKLINIQKYINLYMTETVLPSGDRNPLCDWIKTKLNMLVNETNKYYEEYKLNIVCLKIENFISKTLSKQFLFYIKEVDVSKNEYILSLAEVFVKTLILIAPIMPHISEWLFQQLNIDKEEKSIHLLKYPKFEHVYNRALEEMDGEIELLGWCVNNVIAIKAQSKLQFEGKIVLCSKEFEQIKKYKDILLACTKCKDIVCDIDNKYIEVSARCNKEKYGPILREQIKAYNYIISKLSKNDVDIIVKEGKIQKEGVEITRDMIKIENKINAKYIGKEKKGVCVVLV